MLLKIAVAVLFVLMAGFGVFWLMTQPSAIAAAELGPHTADLGNGRTMFLAGGCASCHATPKQDDRIRLGGGRPLTIAQRQLPHGVVAHLPITPLIVGTDDHHLADIFAMPDEFDGGPNGLGNVGVGSSRFDLPQLESVDMALSYWGRKAVAHTMVSFGFGKKGYVVFSVEIRRKQGEKFSEIGGFFRQYELSLVAATEEDCLRVRTNVRGEEGFLYRVAMPTEAARALFLSYVDLANQLVDAPRFYNTVTANCTTIVYRMVQAIVPGMPLDYRLLLSGYLPEYLQALGALPGGSPAQLRERARYTERAKAASAASFSACIRTHVHAQRPASSSATG